ncbi:hypothetical protein BN2537_16513 [Streptomyces venezuelae]|nr:hypothetical protein BN2537_16513 [Streptomyces venezuelae]
MSPEALAGLDAGPRDARDEPALALVTRRGPITLRTGSGRRQHRSGRLP